MINKSELRKILIEKRKTIDTDSLSKIICKKIRELGIYKTSKNIFAYYPLPYEVNITELFEDYSKNWFLPKVNGENMCFFKYKFGDELRQGKFGVYEPIDIKKADIIPDLIIVPALSTDKNNYRLGYGKGYYDRFLTKFTNVESQTLVPIFSKLILEKLPIEKHDKKIDIVVSEI